MATEASVGTPLAGSEDALFAGRLILSQPATGYRFNADAVWLAAFADRARHEHHQVVRPLRTVDELLDLGSGVGAVGLTLARMGSARHVTLLDRDPEMLAFAARNGARAQLSVETLVHDVSQRLPAELMGRFDLVVTNPPYSTVSHAIASPHAGRAAGRCGADLLLSAFCQTARQALATGGRFCLVYPARDLARVLRTLRQTGLEPKRLRAVHSLAHRAAHVVLVEAKAARKGGLLVEPSLIVMDAASDGTGKGVYSAEAQALLTGW